MTDKNAMFVKKCKNDIKYEKLINLWYEKGVDEENKISSMKTLSIRQF